MTVKELIEKLKTCPPNADVHALYVGDFNDEFEVNRVEISKRVWSLKEGKYLDVTPYVTLK